MIARKEPFHALGISVLYDQVMDVRRGLAQAVSRLFADEGVVVPSNNQAGSLHYWRSR